MKALLLTVLLATSATNVSASENKEDKEKLCIKYSKVATFVMTRRQNSEPLSDLLKFGGKVKPLALKAYSKPLYSAKKNKEREISEFTNNALLACLGG